MYLSSQPHLGKDVYSAVGMPQVNICQCNYLSSQLVFYKIWDIDIKAEILGYLYSLFIL